MLTCRERLDLLRVSPRLPLTSCFDRCQACLASSSTLLQERITVGASINRQVDHYADHEKKKAQRQQLHSVRISAWP